MESVPAGSRSAAWEWRCVALGRGASKVIANDIDENRLKFLQMLAGGESKVEG